MDVSPPNPELSAAGRAACTAWFGPVVPEVGPPPGTGFSGAPLARVRPRGTTAWFVLKAFPAGTARERAEWVHAFVRHLAAAGVTEVPPAAATPDGGTIVTDADGTHWELVPFVAGFATDAPSEPQAVAALGTLGRLHAAAAALPLAPPRVGPSPGVLKAVARGRDLATRPWPGRRHAARAAAGDDWWGTVDERWGRAIALVDTPAGERAVRAIANACVELVPLQAVLRDVWTAHVLHAAAAPGTPARVAGIVDVHAAAIDNPAVDLGRLIGSWRCSPALAGMDPLTAWAPAVESYEIVRRLSAAERRIAAFMTSAGTILGLDSWFRWTLEERRRFPCPDAVVARIDWLLAALPAAIQSLTRGGGPQV